MKRTIITSIIAVLALSLSAQSKTTVRGTFTNLDEGANIYLVYSGFFRSPHVPQPKQTKLHEGKYEFTFDLAETTVFHLETAKMTFYVVCEPGETIEIAENNITKPGRSQQAYDDIVLATWRSYNNDRVALYNAHKAIIDKVNDTNLDDEQRSQLRSSSEYQKYTEALDALLPKYESIISDRIRQDPKNLWNIISLASFSATLTPKAEIYQLFDPSVQNSQYGVVYREKIGLSLVGKQAPAFLLPDDKGTRHPLAVIIKGHRYVLIDFWASWCKPCRKSIPDLKNAYERYRDKGFTIVSISVDSDNAAWLKAVEEEQMPWLQLHDTEGVMRQYGVEGIPSVFLIDCNDGTIVFEKLYGDAVLKGLKQALE